MERSSDGSSKCNCRKHLEPNRHPSGRPMHDFKSLFYCCLQFILVAGAALPAHGQVPVTTFRQNSSAATASQNGASPNLSNSPFLGGTPSGKATAETLQL